MADPEESQKTRRLLFDFAKSFLMPTLVGKTFILYFGLNYSEHPDEGYGIGLAISVIFTLTMLALFFWKYRNVGDL